MERDFLGLPSLMESLDLVMKCIVAPVVIVYLWRTVNCYGIWDDEEVFYKAIEHIQICYKFVLEYGPQNESFIYFLVAMFIAFVIPKFFLSYVFFSYVYSLYA